VFVYYSYAVFLFSQYLKELLLLPNLISLKSSLSISSQQPLVSDWERKDTHSFYSCKPFWKKNIFFYSLLAKLSKKHRLAFKAECKDRHSFYFNNTFQ